MDPFICRFTESSRFSGSIESIDANEINCIHCISESQKSIGPSKSICFTLQNQISGGLNKVAFFDILHKRGGGSLISGGGRGIFWENYILSFRLRKRLYLSLSGDCNEFTKTLIINNKFNKKIMYY